ncbi:hypothetical protein, partial [Marseilla massiliensis]|uniref:hypothetical protein n=1 Tax=Marseilla massiliensis TaxID=1841864 RepID=UPI0019615DD2
KLLIFNLLKEKLDVLNFMLLKGHPTKLRKNPSCMCSYTCFPNVRFAVSVGMDACCCFSSYGLCFGVLRMRACFSII